MRRKVVTLMLTGVLAAGLIVSMTGVEAATSVVKASNDNGGKWKPGTTHLSKGNRVAWKNPTGKFHDIASYGNNWSYSKSLPPGEVRKRRFDKTGTFKFRCRAHSSLSNGQCSGMCGAILVH